MYTLHRTVLFAAALLTAAALVCPPALAQEGKKIEGKLSADQTEQLHKMEMKPGKAYLIEMKSGDFDTYLRLRNSDGQEVAENDDVGNGDLNSRLVFIPEKADTYSVAAGSFGDSGKGDYTLEIKTLNKLGKPKVEKGKLDNNSQKFKGKPYSPYKMKLTAGKTYQIDLESTDFDALLGVRQPGAEDFLAGNDDVAPGNLNARVFFSPTETGEYEIMAASLDENLGDYTLTVQEFGEKGKKKKQK